MYRESEDAHFTLNIHVHSRTRSQFEVVPEVTRERLSCINDAHCDSAGKTTRFVRYSLGITHLKDEFKKSTRHSLSATGPILELTSRFKKSTRTQLH